MALVKKVKPAPSGPAKASGSPPAALKRRAGTTVAKAASRPAEAPVAQARTAKRKIGGVANTKPAVGGNLWRIKDDMTVRFLSEPEATDDCPPHCAFYWFRSYFDQSRNRFGILEEGEEAPEDARVTIANVAAILDRADDNERVKYLQIPNSLMAAIKAQFTRYGSVCDVDAFITKEGKGLNTKYAITFDRDVSKLRNLKKLRGQVDVEAALSDEYDRLQAQPDRPAAKLTREEIQQLPVAELKSLLKRLDISWAGKKRRQLTEEILEAQED